MDLASKINRAIAPLGICIRRVPPPSDDELPLYRSIFGDTAVQQRRFYNIGSAGFRHAAWTNVDHPHDSYVAAQKDNVGIAWDVSTLTPIAVESGAAEIVYTSHTIEHLRNDHVQHMFDEAYRILKPGGFMRVTCPDILLLFEGYRRRNPGLLMNPKFYPYSIQDCFLSSFVSQLSKRMKARNPQGASSITIDDKEVDRVFATMPFDAACDHFTAMCNYELQKKLPGAHINWWHFEKIAAFLQRSGFRNVRRSGYGGSFCPVLCNTDYFDNTYPRWSVYVETEKQTEGALL